MADNERESAVCISGGGSGTADRAWSDDTMLINEKSSPKMQNHSSWINVFYTCFPVRGERLLARLCTLPQTALLQIQSARKQPNYEEH